MITICYKSFPFLKFKIQIDLKALETYLEYEYIAYNCKSYSRKTFKHKIKNSNFGINKHIVNFTKLLLLTERKNKDFDLGKASQKLKKKLKEFEMQDFEVINKILTKFL